MYHSIEIIEGSAAVTGSSGSVNDSRTNSSISKSVLIQEARAYRKHGVFVDRSREDRIEVLEAQVASLEGELK
ncbi:hypothetical protein [Halalkalicoccus salilacus]|uniref:hypothetical protein n=1 Tax=Halalkalicoccus salilacus TaxID=3117459 RepID=UPI00300ED93C